MLTLGCVPYLNAKPLTAYFETHREADTAVVYDVPSKLPAMLATGAVSAILVSSIEALRRPNCRVAAGVSISTQRAVESVRIFHKKPLDEVETLALDASSMTSSALAQVILRERYNAWPKTFSMGPDLQEMLAHHDAAVLIGDNGMRPVPHGLEATDLGEEWFALTGLPFVWALWMLADDACAGRLAEARIWGENHLDEIIPIAAQATGFEIPVADHYLRHIMDYRLDKAHWRGYLEFAKHLEQHKLLPKAYEPTVVGAMAKV